MSRYGGPPPPPAVLFADFRRFWRLAVDKVLPREPTRLDLERAKFLGVLDTRIVVTMTDVPELFTIAPF